MTTPDEVQRNWNLMCASPSGRSALRDACRRLLPALQEALVLSPDKCALAYALAPDVLHAVALSLHHDLDVLLAIERAVSARVCCSVSPSDEEAPLLEHSVSDALGIDFFARTFVLSMRWYEEMARRVTQSEWAIPPLDMRALRSSWHVSEQEFRTRLDWIAPWVRPFLSDADIRRHGVVLSGGIVPLCVLRQEVYAEDCDAFVRYADEVYRNTTLDFYVAAASPSEEERIVSDVKRVLGVAEVKHTERWAEDDASWGARNRRGVSVRIPMAGGRVMVLIMMPSPHMIAQQHLPCVRAAYDGTTLAVTASCYTSWMTRFVGDRPLFGRLVSAARRSRTLLKYAIRGFGFSPAALDGCTLPSTIGLWLRESPHHRPLPWYHILYQPALWRKAMTAQRERDLLACIEQ